MKLTNFQIFQIYDNGEKFNSLKVTIPIEINFYIQKNIETIRNAATLINDNRNFIIQKYGVLEDPDQEISTDDEDDFVNDTMTRQSYKIPKDKIQSALDEMKKLMNIEQDIQIYKIKLSSLIKNNIELDTEQLNLILFMIEDDLQEAKEE